MNIYTKLAAIRKEFHGKELKKSGHNKFAGYKYFELQDFIPTAIELFAKHNVATVFNLENDYASLLLIDGEDSLGKISFRCPVADASGKGQLPIQSLGSQITYLRRYLYMNALEIVESDGIDGLSEEAKKPTKPASKKDKNEESGNVQKAILNLFNDLVKNAGNKEEVYELLGITQAEFKKKYTEAPTELWELMQEHA